MPSASTARPGSHADARTATPAPATHQPVYRPYPGAPGFHLASCPVCDGRRAKVRIDGTGPYVCEARRGFSA